MRKNILAGVAGITMLVSGTAGVAAADPGGGADVIVVDKDDPNGDVKTQAKGKKTEKAPPRIKQSVDIKRMTYQVDRTLEEPSLVITTTARNVLPAGHPKTQRFWTQVDMYNYYFTYIRSDGAGKVKVTYFDRGGAVDVPCPAATVRLFPGKNKERAVQTVPLSCIHHSGDDIAFTSTATVLPKGPRWFLAEDTTSRSSEIHLDPLPGTATR